MKIAAALALAYYILWGWVLFPTDRWGFGLLNALIAILLGVVISLYIKVRTFSKQMAEYKSKQMAEYKKTARDKAVGESPSLNL
ncbi:MAG: hypothetical protein GY889_02380 [Proteobacteria bacterium]|nr:hypothetical protein [Pseudomonadota bacterium]